MWVISKLSGTSRYRKVIVTACAAVVIVAVMVACVWSTGLRTTRTIEGTALVNIHEVQAYKAEQTAKQIEIENLLRDLFSGALFKRFKTYPFKAAVLYPYDSPEKNLENFRYLYCKTVSQFADNAFEMVSILAEAESGYNAMKQRSQLPPSAGDFNTEVRDRKCPA